MYCVGIDAIIGGINCTPLQGIILTATKPPVVIKPNPVVLTNVITIKNLPTGKWTDKKLQRYFSNKRKSGISTYESATMVDKTTAVLQLRNESGKNNLK